MQKFSTFLLALIACAGTIFADGTKIGDLYYNLNANKLTAEVTYQEYGSSTNYSYLTVVNIPESVDYNSVTYSVTSIGDYAFEYCSGLTSITIPNSVTSIRVSAFYYCTSLTSVTIPNSVTSIGRFAFGYCSSLTSITIPNSVTSIGRYAFAYCSGLTSMVVENGNTVYDSRDNCNAIIETTSNTLIAGCKNTIIPNSVTSIGGNAFDWCDGLTSITIPNSVTSIGGRAFYACSGLTSIEIPNSVTSIGDDAFAYCTGLTSVTNYATTPQTITSYVFYVVNTSSCTLYVPEGSISLYQAADVWKDFGNIQAITNEPGQETIEGNYTVQYLDNNSAELHNETITLHVPNAPMIEGFTFLKWQASGDLETGIILQAVYTENSPSSAPEVYTNPANPAQKLIRNGKVYILTGDKTYTITGQEYDQAHPRD